ncbi:hypothetical protein [Sphingosinicella microcystinivorans]|uniref:hypothetical protein n=1 Tax=Sphingosinicella microcystinivorans TaxID=335406 RepID=UPI0022F3D25F|nr:hypothetical protein [Sphingosinicella microcystinivorans]WBX82492.1 hypothetical protein PE061_11690 [Sphingosinicella microcystinivorans]
MMASLTIPREEEIVLQFDFDPGANADAIIAAEALIAWVEAARTANAIINPLSELKVDLVSAEQACLKLRTVFRFVEDKVLGPPADFLDEFPRIKKLVVATVIGIPAGLAIVVGEHVMFPDPPADLSPAAKQVFQEEAKKLESSPEVKKKVQEFYKKVEKQGTISQVQIKEGDERAPPLMTIPRTEFSVRSGLWSPPEEQPTERPQVKDWDVVLTHPVLVSKPEIWRFKREGLPFSAKMEDNAILLAIKDGRLPLHFQEGEAMKVRVEWRERLVGKVWEPVARSYKITKVLAPKPLAAAAPLLTE